jgi:perosamine synthetase
LTFQEYLSNLGGTSFLYANASNGFKDILAYIVKNAEKPQPNIVLPSYIPAKLYRSALAAGCATRFYEVRGKCTFDLNEVERLIDENTVAIFYVHYFGFSHQIEEICSLAARRSIPLIEDCALTIAASYKGKELGTYGDIAVFSMRKMFLYAEGGFLRLGDRFREFRPSYEWRVNSCFSVSKYLKQRAKYAYVRVTGGTDPLATFRVDPPGYIDLSGPQTLNVKMLSAFSERRLAFVDVNKVVHKRRENFGYVSERFPSGDVFQSLHPSLPEGCTPYSYPFLVLNGKRDQYRDELLKQGVVTGAGWPESTYVPSQQGTALLSKQLLELPIHQALTQKQIDGSLLRVRQLAAVG